MLQLNRKEEIINILKKEKSCKIEDLCNKLEVSLSTIHRDLNELEREGSVKKVHGGVLINNSDDLEIRNTIRLKKNVDLKNRIALKALEFVENGDYIFLDNSTTCYYFAKILSESKFQDILIITNSYLIPGLFFKNKEIEVISTGGLLLKEYSCFARSYAIDTISKFSVDKFFFSVAAISIKGEFGDTFGPESEEVKSEMFKRSEKRICLVDSTKFGRIGHIIVPFPLNEVDSIITDKNCSEEIREEFAKLGKKLIIA